MNRRLFPLLQRQSWRASCSVRIFQSASYVALRAHTWVYRLLKCFVAVHEFIIIPGCELSSKVPFYTFQGDEEEDVEHFLELRTVCSVFYSEFYRACCVCQGVSPRFCNFTHISAGYLFFTRICVATVEITLNFFRFALEREPRRRVTWWR